MELRTLEIFCKPDSYAKYAQSPFINGDYVLATDAHIAVYVNKEMVDGVEKLKTLEKDYIGVLKQVDGTQVYNTKIKLESLLDALKQIKLDDNDSHFCPDCKGKGVVDFEYVDVQHYHTHIITDTCPMCNGAGDNKNYEYSDVLGMWFDKTDNGIRIKDCKFNPIYIDKLIQLMRDCDVDECIFVCGNPSKSCHFNIMEGVNVVIMPFVGDDASVIIDVECIDILLDAESKEKLEKYNELQKELKESGLIK